MDQIHPTTIVKGDVKFIGSCSVGPYSVLEGPLIIGNDVHIGSHCSIGGRPQHRRVADGFGEIIIGDETIIRDFVTIDKASEEGSFTKIGSKCYLMHYSHVSHDTIIEDSVTLCNSVQIGGHATVMEGTTVGLSSVVEQHSVIGPYNFFAMGSRIRGNLNPFIKYTDNRKIELNYIGLSRVGLNEFDINRLVSWWNNKEREVNFPSTILNHLARAAQRYFAICVIEEQKK